MDYEKYGDYTEYEDDIPKSKSKTLLILKILIYVVCFAVVGVIVFRMVLFNYYPDSVKNIYFTEKLTEYYNQTDGQIGAKTQDLRAPYDDPDVANFFCDNLIVVAEIGQIQLSVRFNRSAIENMEALLELSDLDPNDPELLTFRLYDNTGRIYENVAYAGRDTFAMYYYYKLVFEDIKFGEDYPNWIRLEVFVKGQSSEEPFAMVPIYENNVDYSLFKDYELSGKEHP